MIHGFDKRRLEVLHKKMPLGLTVHEPDCRGKHTNRPTKISEELREKIREHMSFPTRQSHKTVKNAKNYGHKVVIMFSRHGKRT